ncbi:MAG: PilZ domain-containing protein [Campylobacteraceae bacterium]|nr:PilZ domain-containing protein [Campylobacteraceae bacterium]
MKNEISTIEKDKFLSNSAFFLKEFEPLFIEFFSSLCTSYRCHLSQAETREMASLIYQNVFKGNLDSTRLREKFLAILQQDTVIVGFLVSRSMFYLIENYMKFSKEKKISPQLEILITSINHFIQFFENEATHQYIKPTTSLNFSSNDFVMSGNNMIDIFHKIKEEEGSIKFLNLYQGVPINYEAKVIGIDGENVTFSIDKLQEIAMKLDGHAFIVQNKYFGKHIKADIFYNNFLTDTVVLNNFVYLLNMPAMQREFIRVHPDIVAKVYLHQFGDTQTSGRLYDLSMNGLGVLSSENNGIFVGAKVIVDFDLNSSSKNKNIAVEGEVMNIIECKGTYRYCMRIFPKKGMDKKIAAYILQREQEIIENLKDELKEYIF